jgi:hypothetical protein
MAIFNEILSGRYNRALQKIFAIKGSPPVRQLGGEVMPIVQLFYGVENRYLENWDRFGFQMGAGANAASVSGVQIANPVKSNVIIVIERLDITIIAAAQATQLINVTSGIFTGSLANVVANPTARMDSRGRPSSTALFSNENTNAAIASLGNQYGTYAIGATLPNIQVISTENQEITILPNDAIRIFPQVQNYGLNVNFAWRERLLEESERT